MRKILSAALLLILLLTACGGKMVPPPPEAPDNAPAEMPEIPPEEPAEPEEVKNPLEAALRKNLEEMSLEQKVGQLFFVRVPGENAVEDVMTYHLGGYILFGRDTQDKTANELIQNIASWQRAAAYYDTGIPLLIGVDEEGGTVVRVSSNPKIRSRKFSSPRKLWLEGAGGEGGPLGVEEETREKSLLLKALGFNVNLNPVADISTNPGDFIYRRRRDGNRRLCLLCAGGPVPVWPGQRPETLPRLREQPGHSHRNRRGRTALGDLPGTGFPALPGGHRRG